MDDLTRLRKEYARRERDGDNEKYGLTNVAHQFAVQRRQLDLVQLLTQCGILPLDDKQILEIGCGSGAVFSELLQLGAHSKHLYGIDLLPDRLPRSLIRHPDIGVSCADGRLTPFADRSFDVVVQFTVFSSILDLSIQQQMAQEMCRLLRPTGVIVWYDFWLNPVNRHTMGIRPNLIRSLFPDCEITLKRVTLAPPIARRLVPLSKSVAAMLERVRLLNTHYLAVIRPKSISV